MRDELCGRGVEKPPEGHHCHIHRTRLHESRKARVGDVCVPKMRERFPADRDAVSKIRRVIMPPVRSIAPIEGLRIVPVRSVREALEALS